MSSRYGEGFPWLPEAIECLRDWRGKGHSSSQIAKDLSAKFARPVSRSAVIGKLARMGIEMPVALKKQTLRLGGVRGQRAQRNAKPKANRVRTGKEQIAERRAADLLKFERAKAIKPAAVIQHPVHPDLIAVAPKGIMGLTHSSCRWPLEREGEDGDTLFCCNAKAASGSYCEGHAKRAFSKTQSKDQKANDKRLFEQRAARAKALGHRDAMFGFGLGKRFG